MTSFDRIARRDVSGVFIDDPTTDLGLRLELADHPPNTPLAFPAGVYELPQGSLVLINEPTSQCERAALVDTRVPLWAHSLAAATVLTRGDEDVLRVEIDLLSPPSFSRGAAAFAAACASVDDAFHAHHPLDCLVRVVDQGFRIRAERVAGAWSGKAEPATIAEDQDLSRWRCYRSLQTRSGFVAGWAGWDGERLLRYPHPYALADKVAVDIVPIDGLEVAVIQSVLTPEQRARLAMTERPAWVDIIISTHLVADDARIVVEPIEAAQVNPATVAAAAATAYRSHAQIDGERAECTVQLGEETLGVAVELDHGNANDGRAPTLTVYTRPERHFPR